VLNIEAYLLKLLDIDRFPFYLNKNLLD